MAKYQKYAEYRNTDNQWIDQIPSHWSVSALKHVLATPMTDGPHETPIFVDDGVPFVSAEAVSSGKIDFNKIRGFITSDDDKRFSQKYKPKLHDVYMIKSGATTGVTAIVETEKDFNIWSPLAAMRCKQSFEPYYLLNYLRSDPFQKSVQLSWTFGTQQNIGMSTLENLPVCIPPLAEQRKIASFLSYETAKIDSLIAKQEKLIELLKEKRQAVISHAVTKGLNPDVNMKDSGVEWLGQVPEHWEVIAISKVTQKITNGYVGPTRDILVEEGIPYVQATHIKKGKVNFDNAYFVREQWSKDHAKSILKKDDVLIVQTGAGTGDVGLVSEAEEGFNCHALIILQPKKQQLSGSYLAYSLQSDYGYATLYSIRTGGMHPHLNCGEVQFVKIPVPPLDEQVAITNFIQKNIHEFDQLIEKAKSAIELMQERRTALISSAVTGKIDVRNWQNPNHNNNEANTELGA
ncbi:restriction endonuclease subunit S [Acinetobacter sp. P8-3-8]|uniref:restriction endonuclease subunit S n=1 Tax=Acinetobacter sp. P8-3-8 TaxID=1029823 RepID=UPI000248573E|nr:restriction endonuclease subunit S [Acinetobacter sp. P8-3-8]